MAVAFDAVNQGQVDPGTSLTVSVTISGGVTKGYVLVGVMSVNSLTTTVTIGGSAASLLNDSGDAFGRGNHLRVYGLATGSTTGATACAVSWGATSHSVIAFALAFDGVDQTTSTSGVNSTTTDIGTTSISSTAITNASGDMTWSFAGAATNTAPSSPNFTSKGTSQITSLGDVAQGEWSQIHATTGASDTHTWTVPLNGGYLVYGDVVQAAATTFTGECDNTIFRPKLWTY